MNWHLVKSKRTKGPLTSTTLWRKVKKSKQGNVWNWYSMFLTHKCLQNSWAKIHGAFFPKENIYFTPEIVPFDKFIHSFQRILLAFRIFR